MATASEQFIAEQKSKASVERAALLEAISRAGHGNDIDIVTKPVKYGNFPVQKAGSTLTTEQYEALLTQLGILESQIS